MPSIRRAATVLATICCCIAAQAQVVISQLYPGGSTNGTYLNDYVELLNRGTTTTTLTNHSLQYGTATGTIGATASNVYVISSLTMGPHQYYLIKCGTTGSGGAAVPNYDASTLGLDMGPSGGKLVLSNQTTALNIGSTANPLVLPDSRIVDLVGYGPCNTSEGAFSATGGVGMSNTEVLVRKNSGLQDTNSNGNDFDVLGAGGTNAPRNSGSPPAGTTAVGEWALY